MIPFQVTPELLSQFFGRVSRFLDRQSLPESKVVHYKIPTELAALLALDLPKVGQSPESMLLFLDHCMALSVDTGHPRFFNQLFGGRHWPALLGDWTAVVMSTSLYTYEMAPVAATMERRLIEKMGALAGFRRPSGTFVTGGSNGNLMGMVCAIHAVDPHIKTTGLAGRSPMVAFISEDAHFSMAKAAITIGIGLANVIKIPVDAMGAMNAEALEMAIHDAKNQGKHPFFVGATSGTTIRGSFDPLDMIGAVCQRHRLWLHVDAAFGDSALLSPQLRGRLDGITHANSMVWDAHKLMGVPLVCSAFIVNDSPDYLRDAVGTEGIPYIYHDDEAHLDIDSGHMSLQCGRRNDVLKLWMMWMALGDDGYATWVDTCVDQARQVSAQIEAIPGLELVYPTQFVTVCFRAIPNDNEDINALNRRWRDSLARNGDMMIALCVERGKVYLRLVFLDPTQSVDRLVMELAALMP